MDNWTIASLNKHHITFLDHPSRVIDQILIKNLVRK